MLTSQLDAQRQHFEDRISRVEAAMAADRKSILKETEDLRKDRTQMELKLNLVIKEKQALEKKLTAMNARLTTCLRDLAEEKEFSTTLQKNHTSWQEKYSALEKLYKEKEQEVVDLKEQVRDYMMYIEAQNTISKSDLKDELAEGSVSVGEDSASKNKSRRKKK